MDYQAVLKVTCARCTAPFLAFPRVGFGMIVAVAACVFAIGLLGSARGQQSASPTASVRASPGLGTTTEAPSAAGPRIFFLRDGTSVHIWSPVQPSYYGSAYETFGGQPMRSGDSVLTPDAFRPGG